MNNRAFLNRPLTNDEIFVPNHVKSLESISGRPTRKGLENVIISNGKIVNVVSANYTHLPNDLFFGKVAQMVRDSDMNFDVMSVNRGDRSFQQNYILADENFHIEIKNGLDKLRPMLSFTNAYDGSCKTSGTFGFFREVCSNGLHVAQTAVGFNVKHSANMLELIMPNLHDIFQRFKKNEFYELQRKFEVLAEKPILDLSDFVKITSKDLNLFKFESSEKNPEPGQTAREVIATIAREAESLAIEPNFWLGYNAFNEVIHRKHKKPFGKQQEQDKKLFSYLLDELQYN